MVIGIDISMLVYQGSGVANYTHNLVKALLQHAPQHEYRLFYSSFRKPKEFGFVKEFEKLGAKVFVYPFPPRVLKFLWNQHQLLPVEWLIGKVDVFHSSDFLRPPLLAGTVGVTTLHDLTWKLFPKYHTREIILSHEKKLRLTLKYQDKIITDSQSTKNDLLQAYSELTDLKVNVLPLGIGEQFRKIKVEETVWQILEKYQIRKGQYLLYVGAIEPRKNLPTCLQMLSDLVREKKFSQYQLLIVGRAGWKNAEVFALVKKLKLESRVHFVGFVPDEDLPFFYSAALLTLYLSKYEGYGLPPLESLACGTPVLALKNSSLIEILDDRYLVSDVYAQILLKVKKLLSNPPVAKVKIPTWKDYVQKYLEFLAH